MSGIAERYGIDVETILGANDLPNPHRLDVGQELVILPVKGLLHRVVPGETLAAIALRYRVEVESILEANSNLDPLGLQPGQKIIIPGARPVRTMRSTANVPATSRSGTARKFTLPVQGRLTAGYGQRTHPITGSRDFHEGWDLAAPEGTPIRAAAAGRVTFAGWDGGYGLAVRIDHGNGVTTLYAHASSILVSVGEQVSPGTVIARVGNTGLSTGPHVHLEVRVDGRPVDPGQYF
ncbi:LysM peptidoglycan-binding domain-containing M23 family metallopeptidase [Desulfoscipio geothermicus]|uniref:Murein DD-endopeptidase MepM and murein hydrolase activator NlpD, contain LysM domain n=1 Tax=Desulfoscipio geothermicus DSM 3669 TaxID=1121426 RepID=A0A1I6D1V0_9FIRM|nr:Murein DD-endopeptidase MepM and murein hydrolase activator NlpD, contain LysM domain [Desulfoscipio geothermicus DSM 3669]